MVPFFKGTTIDSFVFISRDGCDSRPFFLFLAETAYHFKIFLKSYSSGLGK